MLSDDTRKTLENIIRGKVIEGNGDNCTTIRNYLCGSFSTSRAVKKEFESQSIVKKEQAKALKVFSAQNNLFIAQLPDSGQFLARGGEADVFLDITGKQVTKINDCVYYATWLEYFNSMVIHNLLFPDTAYFFSGFFEKDNQLLAVVKQRYISADGVASLENISQYLGFNGFDKTKRQDYFNKEFGLILEDMHDENVLVRNENLFFIDTVFYTVSADEND